MTWPLPTEGAVGKAEPARTAVMASRSGRFSRFPMVSRWPTLANESTPGKAGAPKLGIDDNLLSAVAVAVQCSKYIHPFGRFVPGGGIPDARVTFVSVGEAGSNISCL
jgi:hypothetical protein